MLILRICQRLVPILIVSGLVGCDSDDQRLVRLSEQSSARQAEQNQQIARQSHETTQATRELVVADAKARSELIQAQRSLHTELQTERTRLDARREQLDRQQQEAIAAEQRAPIVADAILVIGTLLACLLPLALCGYLLRAVQGESDCGDLSQLLAQELIEVDIPMTAAPEPLSILPAPNGPSAESVPTDSQPI